MSEQTRVTHPKEAPLPTDVEGFDSPAALALDRRSSGNHATDPVWRQSEPVLWKLTHTPWVVLHTGSREKPRHDPADPAFRTNIDDLVQARREAAAPAWLQQTHAQSALSGVAYSSREFMSSEDLPICSGGLGNAAGDQLPAMTGIEPEVCRLNEGHMALAVPECARGFLQAGGQSFEIALAVTRAGNLVATRTAVAAGFDRFASAPIERYLGGRAGQKLGITLDDLPAPGRQHPNDPAENFTMASLAIRGSGAVNDVSRLPGAVGRRLFEPLFPPRPNSGSLDHDNQRTHAGTARQDGCLLARRQLSVGRSDLSLR